MTDRHAGSDRLACLYLLKNLPALTVRLVFKSIILIFMARVFCIIIIYIFGVFLLLIAEDFKLDSLTLLLLITSTLGTYYLCRYFVEHKK